MAVSQTWLIHLVLAMLLILFQNTLHIRYFSPMMTLLSVNVCSLPPRLNSCRWQCRSRVAVTAARASISSAFMALLFFGVSDRTWAAEQSACARWRYVVRRVQCLISWPRGPCWKKSVCDDDDVPALFVATIRLRSTRLGSRNVSVDFVKFVRCCMNTAARLISDTLNFDRRLTRLLHDKLHWFWDRVTVKLVDMAQRCLNSCALDYLADCCLHSETFSFCGQESTIGVYAQQTQHVRPPVFCHCRWNCLRTP